MTRQYQIGPCWYIPPDGAAAGEAPRWIRFVVTELEDKSVSYVVDEAVSPNEWKCFDDKPDSSTWLIWRPTALESGNQASGGWERYFTRQMKDGSQRHFFSQSPTRLGSVLTERLKFDQANSEQYTRYPARLRGHDLTWPGERPTILWPDSFPPHLIWDVEKNMPAQGQLLEEEATTLTKFQQSQVFAPFKFLDC